MMMSAGAFLASVAPRIDVLDPAILHEAAANRDAHPWLLVRVSGYSAYFNDLSPAVQQEIIDRANHQAR